ncbi:MAG: hypothetical protein ACK4RK_10765 [Gemmataceae bacterium]
MEFINCTVHIYRGFDAVQPYPSPAVDSVLMVRGHLCPEMPRGRQGQGQYLYWTHVLILPDGTDVRSSYDSQLNAHDVSTADTVLLFDYPIIGWKTAFLVVMVQRVRDFGPGSYLRVYLDRIRPRRMETGVTITGSGVMRGGWLVPVREGGILDGRAAVEFVEYPIVWEGFGGVWAGGNGDTVPSFVVTAQGGLVGAGSAAMEE